MRTHLGAAYAESWAQDQRLAALGDRTVVEALAAGDPAGTVWRVVWAELNLPDRER
jgi:hypothetical protein